MAKKPKVKNSKAKKSNKITAEPVISSNIRTFVITAIALALVSWDLSFNLGVYGTIFYEKIFTVWVICVVVLIANYCLAKEDRYLNAWGVIAMLTPSLWFALEYWDFLVDVNSLPGIISFWLAIAIMVICLPMGGYIIVSFTQADALKLRPRRLFIALAAITIFIAIVGYGIGSNHRYILSCEDFEVAGSKVPENCYKQPLDEILELEETQ